MSYSWEKEQRCKDAAKMVNEELRSLGSTIRASAVSKSIAKIKVGKFFKQPIWLAFAAIAKQNKHVPLLVPQNDEKMYREWWKGEEKKVKDLEQERDDLQVQVKGLKSKVRSLQAQLRKADKAQT